MKLELDTPHRTNTRRGAANATLAFVIALVLGLAGGWLLFGRSKASHDAGAPGTANAPTLYTCSMHPQIVEREPGLCPICHMQLSPMNAGKTAAAGGEKPAERRVRYWIDASVEPPFVSSAPGKSPAGRELAPVYDEEIAAGDVVTIDPRVVQNMGLRTSAVERGVLVRTLRLPGVVAEPEPSRRDITLRVGGWIEKLHADTEGVHVLEGAPLFEIYSPELTIAIEELLAAQRSRGEGAAELVSLSVRKLVALGISEREVAELSKLERAPRTVTIQSPLSAHVIRRAVVQGSRVEPGATILELSDNSIVWVDFAVTASQLPLLSIGERVRIDVDAVPGATFDTTLSFVHPHFDMQTRTARARALVRNPEWKLREGMLATGSVTVEVARDAILVPREAVLDTGARKIAFVVHPDGGFEPTRVRVGAAGDDGFVQVLEGLAPGERVVTSGQFLLDAESRVRESVKRFLAGSNAADPTSEPALSRLDEPQADAEAVDAVLAPYLELAEMLGAPTPPARPFDALALATASQKLVERSLGATRARAEEVRTRAFELIRADVAKQRELFSPLSEALVDVVRRAPHSRALAPRIYVQRCPMVPGKPGRWLSRREEIANPYFADSMKSCGEVLETIEARAGTAGSKTDGNGAR